MSIVLDAVNKTLEIVLAGAVAANQLPFVASYADYDDAAPGFTPGENDGVTNDAVVVTIVAAPGAGEQRLVNNISVYNRDTAAADVTIQYDNAGADREIVKVNLAVGYSLHFREDQWQVLDTNGAVRMVLDTGVALQHDILSNTHGDAAVDAVTRGSLIYGSAIPEWDELDVGAAHQILKVNAGATDPAWASFDWDDMAAGAGADMVHSHQAAGEGGQLDHGLALTGLGDDDHAQYLLADGTRGLSGAWTPGQIITLPNAGLHLLDTGGDHDLIISPGTDLSVDRILTITTGDAARTITLSGNPTLNDWFDQDVKQAATPTFAGITIPTVTFNGATGINVITVPDNLADALHLSDAGGIEYLKIISTNTQPIIRFNDGGVDVDFAVEANGVPDALSIRGSDGQIVLGVLTAGFVKSTAGGALSVATEVTLAELTAGAQGSVIRRGAIDWEELVHPGAGYALTTDATDTVWDQTPTWTGLHTFNAGIAIAAGQDIAGEVSFPNQPSFSVHLNNVDFAFAPNAYRRIPFTHETWDTGNDYDTGAYKFVAPLAGKYLLVVSLRINNMQFDATQYFLRITHNGTEYYWYLNMAGFDANIIRYTMAWSIIVNAAATDDIYLDIYQDGGTNACSVEGSALATQFQGWFLG